MNNSLQGAPPNIFVIILNWNGKQDTLDCLSTLKNVVFPHFSTIVVDNGSTDDSAREIEKQFPKVTLIKTGENLGFAEGNNVGIRLALEQGADFVLLLNNDTIVDPNILSAFVSGASQIPSAGILGGKIYLYSAPTTFDHIGGKWDPKKGVFELLALREIDDGKSWETPMQCDYACGAALFVKREVFEKIGLLEKKFFLIWEESDFCFRARRAGFNTFYWPEARLWHKVSASFVGGKPHSTYFWWRNRLLWIKRNSSRSENNRIFFKIILPDALHMLKLQLLKQFQLVIIRPFRSPAELAKRKENILKYKAALAGIKDYYLKRFGQGPAWIYKKTKSAIK